MAVAFVFLPHKKIYELTQKNAKGTFKFLNIQGAFNIQGRSKPKSLNLWGFSDKVSRKRRHLTKRNSMTSTVHWGATII